MSRPIDAVSRQEAIDHWRLIIDATSMDSRYNMGFVDGLEFCINDLIIMPFVESEIITKIQNGIKATDADDVYSCGMRNGMRWCISLIDGKEPLYENCPSAQPEPSQVARDIATIIENEKDMRVVLSQPERKKGKWIITSEFEECYYAKCNQCNITQVFYFNKPLTNFCPNCGADMREGD